MKALKYPIVWLWLSYILFIIAVGKNYSFEITMAIIGIGMLAIFSSIFHAFAKSWSILGILILILVNL